MSLTFRKLLAQYSYKVPQFLVAQAPARPRDQARLLVYDRNFKKTTHDYFINLADHLPPRTVLVFNDSKVIPARLSLTKPSGGRVKVLYLAKDHQFIKVMADRKLTVGTKLTLGNKLWFKVRRRQAAYYYLQPNFPLARLNNILLKYGTTPIPPYIKNTSLSERELRTAYQTVFARRQGSIAAPTAALHFTPRLLNKLRRRGFKIEFITLHVNLGTFAKLNPAQVRRHKLHSEDYFISAVVARRLNKYKATGFNIMAVGTTTVRTLESAAAGYKEMVAKLI
ncbi:MAG: S-adenosylmethionine:tRNA ribosyltransferase-isomerase [Candidatus Kerfeldbacteria bacterium]|nr:S-adenosylmethionine:tRNA ribosyltransferase-isomerase [Candidatus Kerfeldbacteria bacterium]